MFNYFVIFQIVRAAAYVFIQSLVNPFAMLLYCVIFYVPSVVLKNMRISLFYAIFISLIVFIFTLYFSVHERIEGYVSVSGYAGRIFMGILHIASSLWLAYALGGLLPPFGGRAIGVGMLMLLLVTVSFRNYLRRLARHMGSYEPISVSDWYSPNFPREDGY